MKTNNDKTKEAILKKYSKGDSREVITSYDIVHLDKALIAMKEYGEQEYKRGIEDGKIIQEHRIVKK